MASSYKVKQGDIFGRIGTSVGQAVAEQVPKEVERSRLVSGLKQFQQGASSRTPIENLTELYAIPGVTPQMIQSYSELAKQQAKSNALNQYQGQDREQKPSRFPGTENQPQGQPEKKPAPSITTRPPIEETLNPYIPKTYDEIQARAADLYNKNQGLYESNPQNAINAAIQEDAQAQARSNAVQSVRTKEQDVQNKVISGLQGQLKTLGVEVPGNVYSDIEDKAIQAVKPKAQGGRGLTEQQALKEYGKELDEISRQYRDVATVGTAKIFSRSPSGNKSALNALQKGFEKRNDLENFADLMVAKNGLSQSKANYLAYPVNRNKDVNNYLANMKELKPKFSMKKGYPTKEISPTLRDNATLAASEKLAFKLNKDDSLLAIGEELKSRGYNPSVWMDYIDKNRNHLDLTERQARELGKNRDFTSSMNDMWMFTWSGLDKLVEQ